ncbi:nucleotidyltransferase domain-containing protein [Nocardia paucivorans]|uniref:nucleotidyltransferase domain-containing protein n=1 Tax=Nocardia paucivorans TaxID=114259 RepID=UPI00031CB1BA|nr:nucleotidyltransferase domain-containing protein [Nocardia paucivorans]
MTTDEVDAPRGHHEKPCTVEGINRRDTPPNLMLEGVVGSVAYGLDTPTSDIDYAGIHVEPTANLLGLHPPARERATEKGRGDADAVYHEIGKAMALMLSCNPTASEVLWLENYTVTTPFGEELIGLRRHFLSAKRVRDAFFGYATSQFRRLVERGRFAGSPDARREKHARHTMRLLYQGYELYTTGSLPVRIPDPAPYFAFGAQVRDDPQAVSVKALIAEYEDKFDRARTVLPDRPNEAPLEDFLQRVRFAHYQR